MDDDAALAPPAAGPRGQAPDPAAAAGEPAALRRVLLNGLSLLGAYVLPRAFTFAAAVVAARALGVATFGAYGTAAALAVMLSIVATLGMMQLLVRELARAPERAPELIGAANLAKAASGVAMMAALAWLVTGPLALPAEVRAAALLLGLSYAIGAWAENLGAWFQAVERMGVWMEAQALFGFVSGASGIALALTTRSLVWFCVAPVLGQTAALGWLLVRAPRPVARAWRAPWPQVRALLHPLVPFAAAFVALTAYYKVDIVLLERWRGPAEAGLYAAAYKFVDVAQALALVAATALYPRLSRAAPTAPDAPTAPGASTAPGADGAEARRVPGGESPRSAGGRWAATRACELALLAAVPAAAVLWLVREPLITGIFDVEYAGSVRVLGLLAPALPALALNMLGVFVLGAAGRMGLVAGLYAAAFVLVVTLDRILIPGMGAAGAAIAMLLAEVAVAVAMLGVLGRVASAAPAARAVAAAGTVAVLAALLGASPLPAVAGSAALVGAGAVVYAALGVVTRREIAVLRKALSP